MVGVSVGFGEAVGVPSDEIVGKRDGIPDGSSDVVGATVGRDGVGIAELGTGVSTTSSMLGCSLMVGAGLVVGTDEGESDCVLVGGALEVGTDEGESDCVLVGEPDGESDAPPVGPAVGARVKGGSLARHEVSVANCSQSKRHSSLPG
jgi:hypothetical protein